MQEALPIDFGIILAAGGSTRMGQPKALLDYNNEPLVNVHIRHFRSVCKEVIVVLGGHANLIEKRIDPTAEIVHNRKWSSTHMIDSLQLAIVQRRGLALITPVDCPPAPPRVLMKLASVGGPAVCTHQDMDGHPIIIDCVDGMNHTGTLKELLTTATRMPTDWSGALENWNTPNDISTYSS